MEIERFIETKWKDDDHEIIISREEWLLIKKRIKDLVDRKNSCPQLPENQFPGFNCYNKVCESNVWDDFK